MSLKIFLIAFILRNCYCLIPSETLEIPIKDGLKPGEGIQVEKLDIANCGVGHGAVAIKHQCGEDKCERFAYVDFRLNGWDSGSTKAHTITNQYIKHRSTFEWQQRSDIAYPFEFDTFQRLELKRDKTRVISAAVFHKDYTLGIRVSDKIDRRDIQYVGDLDIEKVPLVVELTGSFSKVLTVKKINADGSRTVIYERSS